MSWKMKNTAIVTTTKVCRRTRSATRPNGTAMTAPASPPSSMVAKIITCDRLWCRATPPPNPRRRETPPPAASGRPRPPPPALRGNKKTRARGAPAEAAGPAEDDDGEQPGDEVIAGVGVEGGDRAEGHAARRGDR